MHVKHDNLLPLSVSSLAEVSENCEVEAGKCIVNKAGDCRKRKKQVMVKVIKCCPGEQDSMPASATELLSDARKVI